MTAALSITKGTFFGALIGGIFSTGRYMMRKRTHQQQHADEEGKAKFPSLYSKQAAQHTRLPSIIASMEQFKIFDEKLVRSIHKQGDRLCALVARSHDDKVKPQIRFIRDAYLFTSRLEKTAMALFKKLPARRVQSEFKEHLTELKKESQSINSLVESAVTLRMTQG